MDKLSTEILSIIFRQLYYSNIQQCKLACKRWYTVKYSPLEMKTLTVQYRTEDAKKSGLALSKLLEKVKNNPELGSKCKQLALRANNNYITALSLLIPNLNALYCGYTNRESVEMEEKVEYDIFDYENLDSEIYKSWQRHLKTFSYLGYSDGYIALAFSSGVFQRLQSPFVRAPDTNIEINDAQRIFESLKNVPNLEILSANADHIYPDDLNILHQNALIFRSLTLVKFYLRQVDQFVISDSSPIAVVEL
ncbi:hypothetical protein K501DRAFT_271910 [Backusella circina FSU 941]|nr:hypothetical protein K501DRAFT_271910 [Backusella circina FSU 941]